MDNLTEDQIRAAVYEPKPVRAFFSMEPVRDEQASDAAGYPIYVDTPHVTLIAKGDRDHIAKPATEQIKRNFPEEWAAFSRAIATPVYPLRVIPTITPSIVSTFDELGVRTVDQLAALDVPEALQKWKNLATRYIALRMEAEGKTKPRLRLVGSHIELLEAA